MTAPWAGKKVLVEQSWMGGGDGILEQYQGGGIYVTDDGLVWSYAYALPDAGPPASACDIRQFREGSQERYHCLHRDSKLLAKLDSPVLDALQGDAVRIGVSERVEGGGGGADLGGVVLEVPGRGYQGEPLVIAFCGNDPAWQLKSPEATRIISFFRHLRRALGGASRFSVGRCPDFLEPRKEIAPGVVAWWSYED